MLDLLAKEEEYILHVLSAQPYRDVFPLIQKIQYQVLNPPKLKLPKENKEGFKNPGVKSG